MITNIKCPKCGASFEPSDAFKHQLEEQVSESLSKKHQEDIEKARKDGEQRAADKISKEIKDREEQILEWKKRAEQAENEELKIRKEKRDLEEAKAKFELEKQREFDREREKIRLKAVEDIQEKDKFKFDEYEKKIADMSKALDEAKKKAGQGSQQLQGEVLEMDIENMLRGAFAEDEIIPVGKGHEGGDIIQKVKGKSGRLAGIILWETKRANWQKSWLPKLRENARKEGATIAVLVSINLPSDITDFKLVEGQIICSYKQALPLATLLRRQVIHIAFAKLTAENKDEKLQLLYEYLQSESFRHRFEAFAEGVVELQNDLDYERRSMERVWKKRETQINKMKINAARMYGELQGVMGNSLPDINVLSLPKAHEDDDKDDKQLKM